MIIKGKERISASEVAMLPGIDYLLYYGQFLDDFKRLDKEDKGLLIEHAVKSLPDRPDYYDAFLAAVCETLAIENDLPVPKWTQGEDYYLDTPANPEGATRVPGFVDYLIETTPELFYKRNVFFGDGIMRRC